MSEQHRPTFHQVKDALANLVTTARSREQRAHLAANLRAVLAGWTEISDSAPAGHRREPTAEKMVLGLFGVPTRRSTRQRLQQDIFVLLLALDRLTEAPAA